EVVWSGGVSESATINSGGFDFILGTAIGDVINGGTEFVGSGGSASFITVNSGGVEVVGGLATVVRCTINPGGTEVVNGSDAGAVVKGVQLVLGGSINAHIQSGGKQVVEASGNAINTFIDGGVMEVQSGAKTGFFPPVNGPAAQGLVGGPEFTSNGGILQLDFSQGYGSGLNGGVPFNAPISGFGSSPAGVTEELDLRDIAFGSNTKASF